MFVQTGSDARLGCGVMDVLGDDDIPVGPVLVRP
jgi:hypothetical protein